MLGPKIASRSMKCLFPLTVIHANLLVFPPSYHHNHSYLTVSGRNIVMKDGRNRTASANVTSIRRYVFFKDTFNNLIIYNV